MSQLQSSERTLESSSAQRIPGTLKARAPHFNFNDTIPRHWFAQSPVATHLANSLNLIFPMGERFFVRSVHHYMNQIDDPALLADIRGFMGQEGRHASEHQRFFDVLRAQGYEIDTFLKVYEALAYRFLEKIFGPKMRLSTTAACEHFTAMFAERALSEDFIKTEAHPILRDLLMWHAAEELEHKTVAFDVLQKVDSSYALRMAGLLMATTTLTGFWMAGTAMLLAQEEKGSGTKVLRHFAHGIQSGRIGRGNMLKAFIGYMRPGFHPNDIDNFHLAQGYLDQLAAKSAEARG